MLRFRLRCQFSLIPDELKIVVSISFFSPVKGLVLDDRLSATGRFSATKQHHVNAT